MSYGLLWRLIGPEMTALSRGLSNLIRINAISLYLMHEQQCIYLYLWNMYV